MRQRAISFESSDYPINNGTLNGIIFINIIIIIIERNVICSAVFEIK